MITKAACFTDIHFGKKNNSIRHNQDCLDFIDWFIMQVKKEGSVSHIIFLGDFFENRNSVNIQTLDYAYDGLRKLNDLEIPIIILVGNHDLHHRENRNVFSTRVFNELKNIVVVAEPMIYDNDTLLCPFLFKHEYPSLSKFANQKYWYGHFEFREFIISGSNRMMEHGPDHSQFNTQKYIFSGHYHKRQCRDNVIFMGNTFPMDFGDAGDRARGAMFVNHKTEEVSFVDWDDAPTYTKTRLSDVVEGRWTPLPKARIECLLDMEITYTEAQVLRDEFVKLYQLREFIIKENALEKENALGGNEDLLEDMSEIDAASLRDSVRTLLSTGIQNTTTINTSTLISIWDEL